MIEIDELRLVPKMTPFWSIANQRMILIDQDCIVQVKHTCFGSDTVFVAPMQLIFNIPGYFPTVIGIGSDEWELGYSKTLPFEIPKPTFYTFS